MLGFGVYLANEFMWVGRNNVFSIVSVPTIELKLNCLSKGTKHNGAFNYPLGFWVYIYLGTKVLGIQCSRSPGSILGDIFWKGIDFLFL